MTSVLQPMNCAVGRSFKSALRRPIVAHVLEYVDRMLEQPADKRWALKIDEVITAYVAVKLVFEAWDMVLRGVIFKARFKTGVLSLHQVQKVEDLLAKHQKTVQPAVHFQRDSATRTEELAYILRCVEVPKLEGRLIASF